MADDLHTQIQILHAEVQRINERLRVLEEANAKRAENDLEMAHELAEIRQMRQTMESIENEVKQLNDKAVATEAVKESGERFLKTASDLGTIIIKWGTAIAAIGASLLFITELISKLL